MRSATFIDKNVTFSQNASNSPQDSAQRMNMN